MRKINLIRITIIGAVLAVSLGLVYVNDIGAVIDEEDKQKIQDSQHTEKEGKECPPEENIGLQMYVDRGQLFPSVSPLSGSYEETKFVGKDIFVIHPILYNIATRIF